MERVRNVFVLPFHRIRRRTIFHALVLSPLRANDVRVTRGETQGLVFASKEDEKKIHSHSSSKQLPLFFQLAGILPKFFKIFTRVKFYKLCEIFQI